MTITAGQIAIQAGKQILKKILANSSPSISEAEIVNIVRQNVVGNATTIIIEPGKVSPVGEDAILLITQRCMDMMNSISDIEVTYSMAADGTRSISARRTRDVTIEEVIKSVEKTGNEQPFKQAEKVKESGEQTNARILERIRSRVNRPEEREY